MRQHRLHRLNAGPEWGTAKMGKIGVQHCWVLDLVDLLGQETQALGIPFFLVLLHNCEAPLLCLLEVLAGKVSSICPFQPPCHVPYPSFGEGSFPPHSSLQEEGSTERISLTASWRQPQKAPSLHLWSFSVLGWLGENRGIHLSPSPHSRWKE